MYMAQWRHIMARERNSGGDSLYRSSFDPSATGFKILKEGRILGEGESPHDMVERMTKSLFSVEKKFGTSTRETERLMDEFGNSIDKKFCVMSTPVMTNAGRYDNKPLSACAVPPVNLRGDFSKIRSVVEQYHVDGMGTGFNLDEADDPVALLKFLNSIAIDGANSGNEDRPVGNMAIISVYHPKIIELVSVKKGSDKRGEEWKFNISVNASDAFIVAVKANANYFLTDGRSVNARELMYRISDSAYECGDPGLIFMDRMNRDNPTPGVGLYTSTAPCAEVGLTPGETCQFGYVNLGKFVRGGEDKQIDLGGLEEITKLMTRVLDNALEISLEKYLYAESKNVMSAKRKIGIGVCGLADMLTALGLPYGSAQARKMSKSVVAFINFVSKVESHELAKARGSFGAMNLIIGNRYNDNPGFLEEKYGDLDSLFVPTDRWRDLGKRIRDTKLMRNASTIALPPTGRSGLVIDASTGIEPHFSLVDYGGSVNDALTMELRKRGIIDQEVHDRIRNFGKVGDIEQIPSQVKEAYVTALELSPNDHLDMAASIQDAVDESISKTINIPSNSTPEEIARIYLLAYDIGFKGITIFRTGSRAYQPRALSA